ncbi:DUF4292 domain-containing protein [Pedobacter sp. MW01-1-1]|uniref:DUF4292 domain-containing protein n=1 Tax=Pedobacter sp. MW01-1-1 TaxID=3383027 RepID=UPI003FF0D51A
MKRSILNSFLLVASLVVVSACKTKKVVVPPPAKTEAAVDHSKADALTLLASKQIKFNTLSVKAKASLEIEGNANDVTMSFRMKDKEVIWVSITALGGMAEVARAIITPDSIKIMNKLKSEYIQKPFNYIYNFTNKQVNFNTLQALLTGNALGEYLNEQSEVKQENGAWTVSGSKAQLDYRMLFNSLFKVAETNLSDATNGQALKVLYSDYQNVNAFLFPKNMKINTLSNAKRINISLEVTKVEGNVPVEFPFSVPKRYTIMN